MRDIERIMATENWLISHGPILESTDRHIVKHWQPEHRTDSDSIDYETQTEIGNGIKERYIRVRNIAQPYNYCLGNDQVFQ